MSISWASSISRMTDIRILPVVSNEIFSSWLDISLRECKSLYLIIKRRETSEGEQKYFFKKTWTLQNVLTHAWMDGQQRSALRPMRGQVRWASDQSEACKLQAETVKITAVKYCSLAGEWRPGPGLVCKYSVADLAFTRAPRHAGIQFIIGHSLTTTESKQTTVNKTLVTLASRNRFIRNLRPRD